MINKSNFPLNLQRIYEKSYIHLEIVDQLLTDILALKNHEQRTLLNRKNDIN